jgi:hypothetical protein
MLYKAITLPKPLIPKSLTSNAVYEYNKCSYLWIPRSPTGCESLNFRTLISCQMAVMWCRRGLWCSLVFQELPSSDCWSEALTLFREILTTSQSVTPPPFDPLCNDFEAVTENIRVSMSTYEVDYPARGNKRFGALFCFFWGVAKLGNLPLKRKGGRIALI